MVFYRFPSREHVRDIQVLIPKRGRTHLMRENSKNVKRMNEITDFILSLLLLSIYYLALVTQVKQLLRHYQNKITPQYKYGNL